MTESRGELWGVSDAYELYMGRWSRKVAPQFLAWIAPSAGAFWVDVGCGTGVLSEAIIANCGPRRIVGVDPSVSFVEAATARIADPRFEAVEGNAQSLGVEDSAIDYCVSGLVLNFVPDKMRAVEEMVRVIVPGGMCGLYVWDYAGHMQIMRKFFDAALEADPNAREFDDGIKAPICRPQPLRALFEGVGLTDVCVHAIDIPTPFDSFDNYWKPFLGGTGSAPKYFATLAPEQQAALKERVQLRIPTGPDGEVLLAARAWAVKGVKA